MGLNKAVEREREERAERQAAREERLRTRADGVDLASVKIPSQFRRVPYRYDSLEEAFPYVDPGLIPFGQDVLVQIKSPRSVSRGGIILSEETKETDIWNTQVAKVTAFGPTAFRHRETLALWPEGQWCKVGDYVRVPKYGGDRWWVEVSPDTEESAARRALFVLFTDLDLKGLVPDDKVLDIVAYI